MKKINVTLVYAEPTRQHEEKLELERGSVILDVLRASSLESSLLERYTSGEWRVGVFGELKLLDDVVQEGDRIELYRPLIINPKEARRKKAKHKRTSS